MSVQRLLSAWRADPTVSVQVEAWRTIPARQAITTPLPERLHPELKRSLEESGIHELYIHQSTCWQHVRAGEHVAVVTGTASGKTLCYNLPVLDRLLRDPSARALYIFPTKALAQDQLTAIQHMLPPDIPLRAAIYDGDTPTSARPAIRAGARLLLTNPDMLHMGIMPHHPNWAEFMRHLEFVIIDEMHVYRGVFGSHVANVLRRLKRIANFYAARPQFILTSATIANPAELARGLVEEEIHLLDEDGAARGEKHFLIYNPPLIDRDLGLRSSALQESVRLADDFLAYDIQTIIFGRSRRSVEIILTYLREKISVIDSLSKQWREQPQQDDPNRSQDKVRGYRSGYLARQRREIERGIRQGEVRAVVATSALELGIDIGSLEAALLVGYPGSIAATWQQAGRAGRGEESSLAVMVVTPAPLDQFLASHPDYFFDRSPEHALINPNNLLILMDHLRCAAFEIPFQPDERFGDVDAALLAEFLEFFQAEGVLHQSGDRYFWMADHYPAQAISLRSASADLIDLQTWDGDKPRTIGQIDQISAHWMVHPQAIYLHEGATYLVEELNLKDKFAILHSSQNDYYTISQQETEVQLIELFEHAQASGCQKSYGEIQVTTQVTGFRKIRWHTHEVLGHGEVDLPPTEMLTTGYWLALDEATVDSLREAGLWGNDPNNYGPNWSNQRLEARARDNYQCQICGAPESHREHDVHHKTPFRSFESYLQANQLDNLITLCPACHRRAETAVRVRSGLAGLSFVLSHLAPFFLMCDSGDLGVHADPKLSLAEGQPGVVIFDQVPAGIGLSQRVYELHQELLTQARQLVAACECQDGCPSCVGPGGENGSGGKRETLEILKALTE